MKNKTKPTLEQLQDLCKEVCDDSNIPFNIAQPPPAKTNNYITFQFSLNYEENGELIEKFKRAKNRSQLIKDLIFFALESEEGKAILEEWR